MFRSPTKKTPLNSQTHSRHGSVSENPTEPRTTVGDEAKQTTTSGGDDELLRTRKQTSDTRATSQTRKNLINKLGQIEDAIRKWSNRLEDIKAGTEIYDVDTFTAVADQLQTRMATYEATLDTILALDSPGTLPETDINDVYLRGMAAINAIRRLNQQPPGGSTTFVNVFPEQQKETPAVDFLSAPITQNVGGHGTTFTQRGNEPAFTQQAPNHPAASNSRMNASFQRVSDPFDNVEIHGHNFSNNRDSFNHQVGHRANTIHSPLNFRTNPLPHNNFRLPPITIPRFSGDVSEWMAFASIFEILVINNPSISDGERYVYLRQSLSDEAYTLIKDLPPTPVSFNTAWDLLKQRYDNRTVIANRYLTDFYELPALTRPTSTSIRHFTSTVRQTTSALRNLEIPMETFLVHSLARKLDFNTRKAFETEHLARDNPPTVNDLTQFLDNRAMILESINGTSATSLSRSGGVTHFASASPQRQPSSNFRQPVSGPRLGKSGPGHSTWNNGMERVPQEPCPACANGNCTRLYMCSKFRSMSITERRELIRNSNRCFNCLTPGHGVNKCSSQSSCKMCQQRHHTQLHFEPTPQPSVSHAIEQPSMAELPPEGDPPVVNLNCNPNVQVLLATALVNCSMGPHESRVVRCLCDTGSQVNLITRTMAQRLNLPLLSSSIEIGTVSEKNATSSNLVDLTFSSMNSSFNLSIQCAVVDRISSNLPQLSIDVSRLVVPISVRLADPRFGESAPVDLLLGAQVSAKIARDGIFHMGEDLPTLQNSSLGWLVIGAAPVRGRGLTSMRPASFFCSSTYSCTNEELEHRVERFWQLEEVPITDACRPVDELAEEKFKQSLVRVGERFQVDLLFRTPDVHMQLGESYSMARKRFLWLENKLHSNKNLFNEYRDIIHEYVKLGHASFISYHPSSQSEPGREYFMPHHAVTKESSTTTKTRIVFDASAKTSSKWSLNDTQLSGKPVQSELFEILLNFRLFKYAFTADVAKLYRQFLINPEHRRYQRIIWRDSPALPLSHLELNTITFGVASAPFLATRVLKHIADLEKADSPKATAVLETCVYVDDFLAGGNEIEEVRKLQTDLREMLIKYGLHLRKWCVSDVKMLGGLPEEDVESSPLELTDDSLTIKALGIAWCPRTDCFSFRCPDVSSLTPVTYTKRMLLSELMRLFDPLGLVAPVVLKFKHALQRVWLEGTKWDEPLSEEICSSWRELMRGLLALNDISIPRWVGLDCGAELTRIAGFCDASSYAIGCCFYVVCLDPAGPKTSLFRAKSKVLPAKSLTIPAAELEAALLLARLYSKIAHLLPPHRDVTFYSDSEITLGRITSSSRKLDKLVGPRVHRIRTLTGGCHWLHVPSALYPADVISRGTTPEKLKKDNLWWHGPEFLREPPAVVVANAMNQQPQTDHSSIALGWCDYFKQFSNLSSLLRVMAFMLRVKRRARKLNLPTSKVIGPDEFQEALMFIVRQCQLTSFRRAFNQFARGKPIDDPIFNGLYPYVDANGFLRITGRLEESDLPDESKHPLLLPASDHVTTLIFRDEHRRLLHASPTVVLSSLRTRFWPLGGRRNAIRILNSCLPCWKSRARTAEQLVGSLPASRVTPRRAFDAVTVDFAGPFDIRQSRVRRTLITKGYLAVFVCMVTKAIHLELVSDLSTEKFILCLDRFIARRWRPSIIYSDNGTNFRGAHNLLRDFLIRVRSAKAGKELQEWAARNQINWRFNPPSASHMGDYMKRE